MPHLRQLSNTAGRALRVVLVFCIVFYTLLGVEIAALADEDTPKLVEGTVTRIDIYEPDELHPLEDGTLIATSATDADLELARTSIETFKGTKRYTVKATITQSAGADTGADPGADTAAEPGDQPDAQSTGLAEQPHEKVVDVTANAAFAIDKPEIAAFDAQTATIEALGGANGDVEVTCTVYDETGNKVEARFTLTVLGQELPHVATLELLDANGSPYEDGQTLTLDAGTETLDLRARVTLNPVPEGLESTYICTPENGLASQTADNGYVELPDLIWELPDQAAAAIEGSTLKLQGDEPVELSCTLPASEDGQEELKATLTVTKAPADAPYVTQVVILDAQGQPISSDGITVPVEGEATYAFGARVEVTDPSKEAPENTTVYTYGPQGWTDPAGASIETAPCALKWSVEPVEMQLPTDASGSPDNAQPQGDTAQPADGAQSAEGAQSADGTQTRDGATPSPDATSDGQPTQEAGTDAGSLGGASVDTQGTQPGADGAGGATQVEAPGEPPAIDEASGLLTLRSQNPCIVTLEAACADEDPQSATARVNFPAETAEESAEDEEPAEEIGELKAFLSYNPVPRGETAYISSFLSGLHGIVYVTHWMESTDGGQTFEEIPNGTMQTLAVLTDDPYIGRQYKVRIEILGYAAVIDTPEEGQPADVAGLEAYSDPVTIEVGPDVLRVTLNVDYVPEGQDTLFRTDVKHGTEGEDKDFFYLWEESSNGAQTWHEVERGNYPTYSVVAERERLGHLFRVKLVDKAAEQLPYESLEEHVLATSNMQMLAALADEDTLPTDFDPDTYDSDGNDGDDDKAAAPTAEDPDDTDDKSSKDDKDDKKAASKGQKTPAQPETLSEFVDKNGSTSVNFGNNKSATMSPLGHVTMSPSSEDDTPQDASLPPDVHIDQDVTEKVAQQKEEEVREREQTQPGARWNPIYIVEQPDPVQALDENGLALLVGPFTCALLAAGVLEKTLRYREQKRTPA